MITTDSKNTKLQKYFYVTTPIYYVNDIPHIGHAYSSIAADVLARFKRLDGYQVKFLTGTDEHGQKVENSAKKAKIKPQLFVDKMSASFANLSGSLMLSNDDFIRTTEKRHKKAVLHLLQILKDKNYIYPGNYSGWYSTRDEAFYQESELIDGKAPTGAEVVWTDEKSEFFKLSEFQEPLLKFYKENPDFIAPRSRYNEVVSFVKGGLKDLSISRSGFKWGIDIAGTDYVIYVWLDALTNYISGLNYPEVNDDFSNYWNNSLHIIGKDILRFHAVYWPAFLMAANMPLPKKIFAHGWWTNEGEKISKSLGNVIDPYDLCDKYGVDACRYFLMREVPFGKDGNFSETQLKNRINTDLANDYGNLVQRVCVFIQKHCDSKIIAPDFNELDPDDITLLIDACSALNDLRDLLDNETAIHKVVERIWEIVASMNRYVDQQAPWALRKTDEKKMKLKLYVAAKVIAVISIYSCAIIPKAANKALDILSMSYEVRHYQYISQLQQLIEGFKNKTKITEQLKQDYWQDLTISNCQVLFEKVN